MIDCISDLRSWMITDKLMINDSKTEILLIGTRQQLRKVTVDTVKVGSCDITPETNIRNLGAWFDSELNMEIHINKLSIFSST